METGRFATRTPRELGGNLNRHSPYRIFDDQGLTASAAPSVLIVEDERIVAKDLQNCLNGMGYDAFAIAVSAEEAVASASARWPDVVLIDIRIEGGNDGIEAAALLKKKRPVIVIFLTAHADEAAIDRAKRTAPDGYLIKPVKSAELRSTIEVALHRRELDAEREKARAGAQRLLTITENVPIGIAYIDQKGKVGFANHVFRELTPYREDPIGVPAMTVLGDTFYTASYSSRQRALLGEHAACVMDLEQGGKTRKYEVSHLPDRDAAGNVCGVYALVYDVTAREQLTADLRQAHVDLETIVNAVPVSITSWHRDLTHRFSNQEAQSRFPALREGFGRPMEEIITADRYRRSQPFIVRAFAGQRCSQEEEEEQVDGLHYRHTDYIPERGSDGVVGLYTLSFDVTDIRKSHEQVRQLVQRLEAVREEERHTVAVALHDGIAQDLFGLKLGLERLAVRSAAQTEINGLCTELCLVVARCMQNARDIANELRPVALATLGLRTVIAEHARRFGEASNLAIVVTESPGFPKLAESVELLLFRAAQEALTNIARHARASRVHITLGADEKHITMRVDDDGVGITDAALGKPHSLGLLGLRERLELLGGSLAVVRKAPAGTRVEVQLPTAAYEINIERLNHADLH